MKNVILVLGLAMATPLMYTSNDVEMIQVADNSDYMGEYQFVQGSPIQNLKVELSGSTLLGKTETGQAEIAATDKKDKFSFKDFGAMLEFKRDDSGAVKGVTLIVDSGTFEGSKK